MAGGKQASGLKTFIAALGNFSVQYNFSCLSMAVAFMTSHWGTPVPTGSALKPDFAEPAWAKLGLVGAVFAGSFVGMIAMGYIGDIFGRRIGMMLTLSFVVLGSIVSAAASWGSAQTVYEIILGARFVLGFGVGGIYPMAAATAAEKNTEEETSEDDDKIVYDPRHAVDVAKAFFWQTPGSLAPYIVALMLTQVPSSADSTSIQFRVLLGLGAIPAAVVFLASLVSTETRSDATSGASGTASKASKNEPKASPYTIIYENPTHLTALVGTGGCWFLYDVSFYGTSIFTPQILSSIFGAQEDLLSLAWQSMVVGLMGMPGIFIAVALLRPRPTGEDKEHWEYSWACLPRVLDRRLCGWTARELNVYGFVLMTVCFTAMAVAYNVFPGTSGAELKFALFCIIQFSLNWGPNLGTYVQPTQSFPRSIRTTMHGLSAASGKAGAVLGTFMYGPLKDAAGFAAVMWVQAALSIAGCAASYFLLPRLTAEDSAHGSSAEVEAELGSAVNRSSQGAGKGVSKRGKGPASTGSIQADDDDLSDKPLLDS